jgi:hypothetical protein
MNLINIKLIALFLFISVNLFANIIPKEIASKKIEKEFTLLKDGKLVIDNRNGHVHIKSWDKEIVKFDISISVGARNEINAQEMLNNITIDINKSDNLIKAITVIESKKSSIFKFNFSVDYEINYIVFVPKNIFLDLTNKYGNSEVESLDREIYANIKYGNIDFDCQHKKIRLNLSFGEAHFDEVTEIEADIKYGKLTVDDVEKLILNTKFSNIKMTNVYFAKINSQYDNFKIEHIEELRNKGKFDNWTIGSVREINVDTKYSEFEIQELNGLCNFEQKHGNIDINLLGKSCEKINLDLQYVTFKVRNSNIGIQLDFEGIFTDCVLEKDFNYVIKNEDDIKKSIIKGEYGNGAVKIKARMKYGLLRI